MKTGHFPRGSQDLEFKQWMAWMGHHCSGSGSVRSIELERVLCGADGVPCTQAHKVLEGLDSEHHSHEPAPWQMECKTGAVSETSLRSRLQAVMAEQDRAAAGYGLELVAMPVVFGGNPPILLSPATHYKQVAAMIRARAGEEGLRAALAVASWQFNIGCTGPAQALERYNRLVRALDRLITLGDLSHGQRLALYKRAAPNWEPRELGSASDLYQCLLHHGVAEHPNRLQSLVQIKKGWIVEVRTPDACDDVDCIMTHVRQIIRIAGD
jgi:hypothetical protein